MSCGCEANKPGDEHKITCGCKYVHGFPAHLYGELRHCPLHEHAGEMRGLLEEVSIMIEAGTIRVFPTFSERLSKIFERTMTVLEKTGGGDEEG